MMDGDETPSDGLPAHRNYLGMDEADDEVFEEEEAPSRYYHSRYDHSFDNSRPVELKVRKEVMETGYRGYIPPTTIDSQCGEPVIDDILHKVWYQSIHSVQHSVHMDIYSIRGINYVVK